MNTGHSWSRQEETALLSAYLRKPSFVNDKEFATWYSSYINEPWATYDTIRVRMRRMKDRGMIPESILKESQYPVYDEPLVMTGDALVITDLELPFHHAEFVNNCLHLAKEWKIKNLILGGDALHFDTLSNWEPNWTKKKKSGLSEDDEARLMEAVKNLPSKNQSAFMDLIVEIGRTEEQDGVSTELEIARRELKRLEKQFDQIDFVMGNHEGRLLRALQSAISPDELARLLEINNPRWRIAPYYYSVLISGGEKFQIEHPKNTSKYSAARLASKYGCHVLMGHNHHVVFQFDQSGKYYALEIGHGVDETRLPYAAQRHNIAHAHVLGACIVRDGIPWLLHAKTDWRAMLKGK